MTYYAIVDSPEAIAFKDILLRQRPFQDEVAAWIDAQLAEGKEFGVLPEEMRARLLADGKEFKEAYEAYMAVLED